MPAVDGPTGLRPDHPAPVREVERTDGGECNLIAWDRGVLLPDMQKSFDEMAITEVLAHEYGHSVQHQAGRVNDGSSVLLGEQQADCFAGAYMR